MSTPPDADGEEEEKEASAAPDQSPTAGLAGRIGEKMLQCFDFFGGKTSLNTLSEAAAEAVWAVPFRSIVSVILISIFTALAGLYEAGAQKLDDLLHLDRSGSSAAWVTGAGLWLAGTGGVLVATIKDADGKWKALNWLLFCITAGACFTRNASVIAWLLILTGQFTMHWFLMSAACARERKRRWLQEQENQQRRAQRAPAQRLDETYRGVQGFGEDESSK